MVLRVDDPSAVTFGLFCLAAFTAFKHIFLGFKRQTDFNEGLNRFEIRTHEIDLGGNMVHIFINETRSIFFNCDH